MGIARSLVALRRAVVGQPMTLPVDTVKRFPELNRATWRRGGLPVRVGGWCLGQRSVSAIALWRTIWLASDVVPSDELLLHELCHVEQFGARASFPLLYLWQSLRHGYVRNRFEVDARAFAATRMRRS